MAAAEELWLSTNDHPRDLLEMVERTSITGPLERKWRLFLCGVARRVQHLAEQPIALELLTAAERYADGELPAEALAGLWRSARPGASPGARTRAERALDAVLATGFPSGSPHTFDVAVYAADDAAVAADDPVAEWAAQSAIVKDVFGNPFRPVTVDPAWLAWNEGVVRKLARTIYQERAFETMGVLADALEEAGCTDDEVLCHCRRVEPHARGCWLLDRLLGKE